MTFQPEDLLEAAREGLKQVERAMRNARRRRAPDLERIRRCEASLAKMRGAVQRLEQICRTAAPRRTRWRSRARAS